MRQMWLGYDTEEDLLAWKVGVFECEKSSRFFDNSVIKTNWKEEISRMLEFLIMKLTKKSLLMFSLILQFRVGYITRMHKPQTSNL